MPDYRAFVLGKDDHIVGRHDFQADDNAAALEVAKKFVDGNDIKVWHLSDVVGRLERKR